MTGPRRIETRRAGTEGTMFSTALRKIHRLSRRLWVRVTLVSGIAFVALGAAKLFGQLDALSLSARKGRGRLAEV